MTNKVWQLIGISIVVQLCMGSCTRQTKVAERSPQPAYELAIVNINLFDSKNKNVLENKTILINADTIAAIVDNSKDVRALNTIEGKGRLVVPGFIDTHTHLYHTFGDAEHAPDSLDDSHRQRLSEAYLKYGTTTIVEMGQTEKWISASIEWQKNPLPDFPNLYISGGALISALDRPLAFTHAEIASPEAARKKVKEYAKMGIKHIKLYSFLDEPEFSAAVEEAKNQKLTISGHVDRGGVSMFDAMESGVSNFEHMLSLPSNVIDFDNHWNLLNDKYDLVDIETIDEWVAVMILSFEYIEENPGYKSRMNELLDEMAKNNATLSTTIHQMGAVAEETYFFTSFGKDSQQNLSLPNYSEKHKLKLKKAFGVLMRTLKQAFDKGIKIRIGTDSRRGGEALLSELLLLSEAGIPVEDILQIATWNGAEAMKIESKYGSIETGKKADLLIFEQSPFDNYKNFLSEKTVIKGGKVFKAN
ncbi:amidohydrolase family protein [Pontibacter akesuensis]|uniref:Amidohydrolase family protein n=1 Tax=Pontibacter akesuensis TaxID=388950 RepID=A0A1I7FH21_9BACT|nr:amidohydrolase family protein [Pontibacter akesuensis]GHA62231.1 amidohydrolase [Pontibacter akesuensis]SFU35425.1 Amidohydrolase family protein [Pontibacter akesuensis]